MKREYIIYQPLFIQCDTCKKSHEISVPYKFYMSTKDGDLYIKQRLESEPTTCKCSGIDSKIIDEYTKMDFNFLV